MRSKADEMASSQLNPAHGPETKKIRKKLKSKNRIAQKKRCTPGGANQEFTRCPDASVLF